MLPRQTATTTIPQEPKGHNELGYVKPGKSVVLLFFISAIFSRLQPSKASELCISENYSRKLRP